MDRRTKGQEMIPKYQQFMRPFLEIEQNTNGDEALLRTDNMTQSILTKAFCGEFVT